MAVAFPACSVESGSQHSRTSVQCGDVVYHIPGTFCGNRFRDVGRAPGERHQNSGVEIPERNSPGMGGKDN